MEIILLTTAAPLVVVTWETHLLCRLRHTTIRKLMNLRDCVCEVEGVVVAWAAGGAVGSSVCLFGRVVIYKKPGQPEVALPLLPLQLHG